MSRFRIGILATHPVQYYAPWYRALAARVNLTVYFSWRQTPEGQAAAGFGVPFDWDVPVTEGYEHAYLSNVSRNPSVDTFFGCDTPGVGKIIDNGKFDAFIVHGWFTKSYWQAVSACRRRGVPVLVRGDSHLGIPRSWAKRRLKEPVYRALASRFDGFLAVGRAAEEYYRHYGAPAGRVFFSPHCVDNARFAGESARLSRAECRRAWGIPDEATVYLFAGKLIGIKRPMDFARAVSASGARGIVAGDGPLRAEMEAAANPERRAAFAFAGFLNQSEMPRAYKAADALVVTSESESWGLTVNEAMASGIPAIVSDGVGCRHDLIFEGETGRCYRRGDIEGLGQILATETPASLAAMGRAAAERIRGYSPERAADGVLEAVGKVRR